MTFDTSKPEFSEANAGLDAALNSPNRQEADFLAWAPDAHAPADASEAARAHSLAALAVTRIFRHDYEQLSEQAQRILADTVHEHTAPDDDELTPPEWLARHLD